ncbi:MAG: hypothetical protein ACKO83_07395 [Roseiflexaceae bacterium]
MNSMSIVVYAWSRIFVFPVVFVLVMALRTAPAMGWPRGALGTGWAAWLALALVPFPSQVTLGDVDLFVLMVLLVFASRTADHGIDATLIAGWIVVMLALMYSYGTVVVTRMNPFVPTGVQMSAYVAALGALAWVWWRWPWQTLPQRVSMAAIACIWAGVASAAWDWTWQWGGLTAVCLGVTYVLWWFRQTNHDRARQLPSNSW